MDSRRKRSMLRSAARPPQSGWPPRFGQLWAATPCRLPPPGAAACRRIVLQYRIGHLVAPNLGDKKRQSIIHANIRCRPTTRVSRLIRVGRAAQPGRRILINASRRAPKLATKLARLRRCHTGSR